MKNKLINSANCQGNMSHFNFNLIYEKKIYIYIRLKTNNQKQLKMAKLRNKITQIKMK